MRAVTLSILFTCLISVTPAFASGGATITQPANGATVSGKVAISIVVDRGVSWSNFYVDGDYYASTPPSTITFDSTKVSNGVHTISVRAYSASKVVLGNPSIRVLVANQADSLKLSSPIAGSRVSGSITISANQPSGVVWENFYVDGGWIKSTPPSSFSWNTNQIADGAHTISVVSYGNSGKLGADSLSVVVANQPAPSASILPTPTAIPTPVPTPVPTAVPTVAPTTTPTIAPTVVPTATPTAIATVTPTAVPTVTPTAVPTVTPTAVPTVTPTAVPTVTPTAVPTVTPTEAPTDTPTVTPTVAPTSTPTVAPTATPTVSPTASPTPVTSADYYVSTTGSDGNNGMTPANAWRTLQHAVNTMPSGDVALVAQGTYNERVSIVRDDITIKGDPNAASTPVVAQGFDIRADNVTVDGFEISFRNSGDPSGSGIHIHDSSNVVVQNNYIHDLCHEGVLLESTVSNVKVLNNKIVHAQMTGINIDGSGDLVEGNEIWGTYQHPGKLGGIFAACTNDGSGADADIIRFFGANHIIRSNYGHDIQLDNGDTSKPNPDPHIDCFQTWGRSGESTTNIMIEGNICRWSAAQGEIGSIEALNGPVGNITFQNNIFQNMRQGLNATRDGGSVIGQLNFYNNTFDHFLAEAIIVDGGARNDNIENNIFYDIVGGDGFVSYSSGENFLANVFYTRAGAPSRGLWWGGAAAPPFLAVDPLFVNYGDSTGLGADYHLCIAGQNGCTATSTVGHAGATISSVLQDIDGELRIGGYSIGAHQITQ